LNLEKRKAIQKILLLAYSKQNAITISTGGLCFAATNIERQENEGIEYRSKFFKHGRDLFAIRETRKCSSDMDVTVVGICQDDSITQSAKAKEK